MSKNTEGVEALCVTWQSGQGSELHQSVLGHPPTTRQTLNLNITVLHMRPLPDWSFLTTQNFVSTQQKGLRETGCGYNLLLHLCDIGSDSDLKAFNSFELSER
jgi:hypothetical protein